MDRAHYIQELMEGFHVIQQKMLEKIPVKNISHITFSQWRVLDILDRNHKATIKEIHTALGISSSAATQLVNELVKKKYAVRESTSNDRRVSSVVLSPKTRTLMESLKQMHLTKILTLFHPLSDKEFEQFINLHKKVIQNI